MKILKVFLLWRTTLFLIAFVSQLVIITFGGRFPYTQEKLISTGLPPWIWGFGNFDGVHYLGIAQKGYFAQYSQAFFPLYPLIIKLFTLNNLHFMTALVISNFFLLVALYFLYKLFQLDYSKKISFESILLLLVFPTAFYFGSVYSESLFLLLVVLSLYFTRKKNFFLGGFFGGLSSLTRIFGLFLMPVIAWEIYLYIKERKISVKSKDFIKAVIGICLAPLGTLLYMGYLKINFDNPLYFLTSQPLFGAERSGGNLIFLPQVLFRYFKILTTIPPISLPFFNAFLEVVFTLIPLGLLILAYKKVRLSYLIFICGCLLLPTLTGTLSSMPRYALMSFLLFPFIMERLGRYSRIMLTFLFILEAVLLGLFIRGYWVA